MTSGTQTSYVLALRFDLVPEELRAAALKELVRDIERRNFHLSTGFVGTPYLMDVLQQHGRLDVAYKVLEQETFPSWLYPVKNGATTVWERWDGWTPEKGFQDKSMNSFNHFAYGAIGNWIYRNVGGLDLDPAEPGYRHIIFRPLPGGTITWADTRLETPQGETSIRWDLNEDQIDLDLLVPVGARATLFVPEAFGGNKVELTPGRHQLTQKKAEQAAASVQEKGKLATIA
jgi:alpha-L-rhamnosidase